jgi:hypothetical protein
MEYFIKARSKRTEQFIEGILPSMISQLGLNNSRKTLFIKVSKSDIEGGNDGQTAYIKPIGGLVVIIKPQPFERMGVTLAHEMVHVKQLAKGILKTVKGVNYWQGQRYTRKTKYLNQPWEIEAFSKQELIFRRALEV